jgi:anaerobic ribonucleoside-triphosphate reductase activating protein
MNDVYLVAPVEGDSIVDGEGLRIVIWFQGCPHHCPGCHNPESHAFKTGIKTSSEKIIEDIKKIKDQDGITFSGGEPMSQPEALLAIAEYAKKAKLNVWSYTGYLYEDLLKMAEEKPVYKEILNIVDVLVDGPFILAERSLNLKFRGSRNQRIINVPKSLKTNKVVLISKYMKEVKPKSTIKVK